VVPEQPTSATSANQRIPTKTRNPADGSIP